MAAEEDSIVLVVQGRRIQVDRVSLALVSKFFKALFSHQFEDSNKPVLHLDAGGEMGLTVAAVQVSEDANKADLLETLFRTWQILPRLASSRSRISWLCRCSSLQTRWT